MASDLNKSKNILFVCVGNTCRSPMAAAYCNFRYESVTADSAGISTCGEDMQEIIPGDRDASEEKHVPVYKTEGDKVIVSVGSVEHPMFPEHYIEWVALVSDKGFRIAYLEPGQQPCVECLEDEKVEAVYAYCNLHGLWKTEA